MRFLLATYLAEAAIKSIGLTAYAALEASAPAEAYKLAHIFVRADGLGDWETAIREATGPPVSAAIAPDFQDFVSWAAQSRAKSGNEGYEASLNELGRILGLLGVPMTEKPRKPTMRDLIGALVVIRNKTKAHGAVGADFFADATPGYERAIEYLLTDNPAMDFRWLYLAPPDGGQLKAILLKGPAPASVTPLSEWATAGIPGIYIVPNRSTGAFSCGDLIQTGREAQAFWLPNGSAADSGSAEFINYADGAIQRRQVDRYLLPPAPLPRSETHGHDVLDIKSDLYDNLPSEPRTYVERKTLQDDLEARLGDHHPIITLHGRGGVGKTSLALHVAHELARAEHAPFEAVVWLSARDVDLAISGPQRVQPSVLDLASVARAYGELFHEPTSIESLAAALQQPHSSGQGRLFIFDNFESMRASTAVHEFLDTHTRLPNKVLITSRERSFKADYPIEVKGLEPHEARELIRSLARDLGIEGLATDQVISELYEYTEGHAYVMRILVGEMAKEGRYVPTKRLMSQRMDIVDAVFEQSFLKLSTSARWVFLTVANWSAVVSELALLVVLGQRDIAVEAGVGECLRLSLLTVESLADGQPCYYAPQLARVFAKKKLAGDPDQLLIREDIQTLIKFGALTNAQARVQGEEAAIRKFVDWAMKDTAQRDVERVDHLLESIAALWPKGWWALAQFRRQKGIGLAQREYALRRLTEELPYTLEARDGWLERAKLAGANGDEITKLSFRINAVDAQPTDVHLMSDVAAELAAYLTDHKTSIPRTQRGVYLSTVRAHMQRVASHLDATGLSRLAWLFLLEDDEAAAWQYVQQGYEKDPRNPHCRKLVNNMERRGLVLPQRLKLLG